MRTVSRRQSSEVELQPVGEAVVKLFINCYVGSIESALQYEKAMLPCTIGYCEMTMASCIQNAGHRGRRERGEESADQ
jgi:hypothetical protein